MIILPQYLAYKFNTNAHRNSFSEDEIQIIIEALKESNDPYFILVLYSMIQKRQTMLVKVHPHVNEKAMRAWNGEGEFESQKENIKAWFEDAKERWVEENGTRVWKSSPTLARPKLF